ncbi:hypothetical protein ACW9IO_19545 [Pseudomonas azotoformans]|uniref:hypothetical protein n=1 Tax=Pseudomonas tolaasii TaxID=29442 RepID=UPI0015A3CFC5|nr:hypothetical protein [Pseudomonas tolaasii]NWC26901.1 hypothetical protein [Pseudomonas tolaasii]
MSLTKPNQQPRRDLKEAAALLKWAGVDLLVVSKRMLAAGDGYGAREMVKIAASLQEAEGRLGAYADETNASELSRVRHEQA